jgi:hypothetical protein
MRLLAYCRAQDWAGYDPYDALNSRLFTLVPALDSRLPRLVLTQALKRSPVNLRPLLAIPPTQNPKALALFLASAVRLRTIAGSDAGPMAESMIERLVALRSPDTDRWAWGYSFPWQTRTKVVPRATPNLVCTTFVADALLDAFEAFGRRECLTMAIGAAEYLLDELYRFEEGGSAGFSYPLPSMPPHIHNANLLGAALFARVHRLTGDDRFRGPALQVARWASLRQRPDGSWPYGEGAHQGWIDNFHTGYNLCALRRIGQDLETDTFEAPLRLGFRFYLAHFFRADGAARYFHDRTYPIDIHCVAQSIITLLQLEDLDPANRAQAEAVWRWAMAQMWDERGFFYYRVLRLGTIRTSYMRWSQAWMLNALSMLAADSAVQTAPRAARQAAISA